jgi:hypothetical protein
VEAHPLLRDILTRKAAEGGVAEDAAEDEAEVAMLAILTMTNLMTALITTAPQIRTSMVPHHLDIMRMGLPLEGTTTEAATEAVTKVRYLRLQYFQYRSIDPMRHLVRAHSDN